MPLRGWIKALSAGLWRPQGPRPRSPRRLWNALQFARDYLRAVDQAEAVGATDPILVNPYLHDRTATTPFDPHYLHQDVWALRRIMQARPSRHVDVGSRVVAVGFFSCVVPVEFVDIRPLDATLPNLRCREGSILNIPYEDQSLESVSSLHVAEHIGLGRYGDPLDVVNGTRNACLELQRVLRPGGRLYFSLPLAGRNRIEFNGHRVHTAARIRSYFSELTLLELSGVMDDNEYVENVDESRFGNQQYSCGLFIFTRPEKTSNPSPV